MTRIRIPEKLRQAFAEQGRIGGKKGGPRGGKARWVGVPAKERSEITRKAVQARWAKVKKSERDASP